MQIYTILHNPCAAMIKGNKDHFASETVHLSETSVNHEVTCSAEGDILAVIEFDTATGLSRTYLTGDQADDMIAEEEKWSRICAKSDASEARAIRSAQL